MVVAFDPPPLPLPLAIWTTTTTTLRRPATAEWGNHRRPCRCCPSCPALHLTATTTTNGWWRRTWKTIKSRRGVHRLSSMRGVMAANHPESRWSPEGKKTFP